MSFGFKFIGERINEDKIIPGAKESTGMPVKDNGSEKDGFIARLFAEEAVTTRDKALGNDMNKLKIGFADNFPVPLVTVRA